MTKDIMNLIPKPTTLIATTIDKIQPTAVNSTVVAPPSPAVVVAKIEPIEAKTLVNQPVTPESILVTAATKASPIKTPPKFYITQKHFNYKCKKFFAKKIFYAHYIKSYVGYNSFFFFLCFFLFSFFKSLLSLDNDVDLMYNKIIKRRAIK